MCSIFINGSEKMNIFKILARKNRNAVLKQDYTVVRMIVRTIVSLVYWFLILGKTLIVIESIEFYLGIGISSNDVLSWSEHLITLPCYIMITIGYYIMMNKNNWISKKNIPLKYFELVELLQDVEFYPSKRFKGIMESEDWFNYNHSAFIPKSFIVNVYFFRGAGRNNIPLYRAYIGSIAGNEFIASSSPEEFEDVINYLKEITNNEIVIGYLDTKVAKESFFKEIDTVEKFMELLDPNHEFVIKQKKKIINKKQ